MKHYDDKPKRVLGVGKKIWWSFGAMVVLVITLSWLGSMSRPNEQVTSDQTSSQPTSTSLKVEPHNDTQSTLNVASPPSNNSAPSTATQPSPATTSYPPAVNEPAPVIAPTSAPFALTRPSGVLNGTYYYKVSFVSSTGQETDLGPASLSVSPSNQEVWVTDIPISSNSSVSERKLYRTMANGSMVGPFYLVTTIYDNYSTSYFDNTPDGSLPTWSVKY